MTTQCKAVLSGLKKLTNNTESCFSYVYNSTYFCLDDDPDKTYNYENYSNEIEGIITLLIQEGYLANTYSNRTYQLTQKGIHNKQFTLHKVMNYFSDKLIDIIAVVISIIALLNSYGYDLLTPIFDLCKKLLKL